ncbi:MAG: hypothetical protein RJB62_1180 [Pseudomonadota bacterium]
MSHRGPEIMGRRPLALPRVFGLALRNRRCGMKPVLQSNTGLLSRVGE